MDKTDVSISLYLSIAGVQVSFRRGHRLTLQIFSQLHTHSLCIHTLNPLVVPHAQPIRL